VKSTETDAGPLVSVVIPCFNQARFLPRSIGSVRRQGYRPTETIVVDDGSDDDTSQTAAAHGATVFRRDNRGVSAARNAGLLAAVGTLIVFLDADDELMDDALASGAAMLTAHPEASCVVRRCRLMDAEGRPLPTTHPVVDASNPYREWLRRNFVWTPGAAMFRRRDLVDIGGFPDHVGPAADYAVYLQLARAGTVLVDGRDAVLYRQHDSNMSRDSVTMLRATLDVLRRERPHVPPDLRREFGAGQRGWRAFYGEQIVEQLRRRWRTGEASGAPLVSATWTLVRHCPRVTLMHLRRKLARAARGLPPAALESGRFVPPLRRPGDAGE
jgi:glycosyltransferase involved in cell wall biosynthesis